MPSNTKTRQKLWNKKNTQKTIKNKNQRRQTNNRSSIMECHSPIWIPKENLLEKGQYVPCGKCIYCLETKRSIWTFRILQELKVAETARFVTLTYEDEKLPYIAQWGDKTTEINILTKLNPTNKLYNQPVQLLPTLNKNDLSQFIKKLRSKIYRDQLPNITSPNKDFRDEANRYLKKSEKTGKWSPKLRYFACGEYGSKGNRPHFHIIIFNIPLRYYQYDTIHNEWYSNTLDEIWGNGNVHIGTVERGSAHYTAKYTIKSLFDKYDPNDPRTKPYAVMSRNPGIGNNYINNETKTYFNNTQNNYTRLKSGHAQPIGRYYKDKIWPEEKITDGLSIWPKERNNASKKCILHTEKQKNTQLLHETAKEYGDISQAKENIRKLKESTYNHKLKTTFKQTSQNKKL